MNSTVYRMPAGQGPGFRVVCSTCRKTGVAHLQTKAHERPSCGLVVPVDGVIVASVPPLLRTVLTPVAHPYAAPK